MKTYLHLTTSVENVIAEQENNCVQFIILINGTKYSKIVKGSRYTDFHLNDLRVHAAKMSYIYLALKKIIFGKKTTA